MYNSLWKTQPHPSPELPAEKVVRIQLAALQNNDLSAHNEGIAVAYRFASPQNKEATGPLRQFAALVKTPLYRPMIGFERAVFDEMHFSGEIAYQQVTLHRTETDPATYVFTLSRQSSGELSGCWMTDGVLRIG